MWYKLKRDASSVSETVLHTAHMADAKIDLHKNLYADFWKRISYLSFQVVIEEAEVEKDESDDTTEVTTTTTTTAEDDSDNEKVVKKYPYHPYEEKSKVGPAAGARMQCLRVMHVCLD